MSLKIYFCGSIRGGRQDLALYTKIVEKLKHYGTVLTEHIVFPDIKAATGDGLSAKEIFDRDMRWLEECDVVVAEVTQPSLGVGIEIGTAIFIKKKTLCLFRPSSGKVLSALVSGAENGSSFIVKQYEEPDLDGLLKNFLEGDM